MKEARTFQYTALVDVPMAANNLGTLIALVAFSVGKTGIAILFNNDIAFAQDCKGQI